jgi:hypothetical protein
VPPDDEFKRQLIAGIERNGGLRGSAKSPTASLFPDISRARHLFSHGNAPAAATIISKHISSENVSDEVAAVARLTGLKVARQIGEEELDSLVQQLSEKGELLLQTKMAAARAADDTRTAVKLAELERAFGSFPSFAGKFDTCWKSLLARANVPHLKEQAQLIDKARQAESGPEASQAIAAYEQVLAAYPGTKAADLSELRITQLRAPKSAPSRLWKSKSGQLSVNAALVAFDGKSAQLRTDEGKTITVALDALSAEDQQFLKTVKPQN